MWALKTIFSQWLRPHWVLLLFLGGGLLPVFIFQFYGTLDGPAHLHNATLIATLLKGDVMPLFEFYQLNSLFIPNVLGHYLLAFLQWLMPIWLAEKVVILVYALGTPYFLYQWIKTETTPNWGVVLFSIFTIPFFLILGFYNFLISVTLLFATLYFWDKWVAQTITRWQVAKLILLVLATYLAHIFTFFLLCGLLFLHQISFALGSKKYPWRTNIKRLIGVLIFPIVLALRFITRPVGPDIVKKFDWLPVDQLLQQLYFFEPFVSYDHTFEVRLLRWFPILMALATLTIKWRIWQEYKNGIAVKPLTLFWGLAVVFSFFGLFLLPNSDGSAGFFSIRISFFFFLFWIIWIALHWQHIPKPIAMSVIIFWLGLQLPLYGSYYKKAKDLNIKAMAYYKMGQSFTQSSTVLPLGQSSDWLTTHFIHYTTLDQKVVLLNNYEAANDYFPVKWNNAMMPQFTLHETPLRNWDQLSGFSNGYRRFLAVDNVVIYPNFTPPADFQKVLNTHYHKTVLPNNFVLYRNKN